MQASTMVFLKLLQGACQKLQQGDFWQCSAAEGAVTQLVLPWSRILGTKIWRQKGEKNPLRLWWVKQEGRASH